jgi:hypothetical protein
MVSFNQGTTIMNTFFMDAMPVAVSGVAGATKVSLLDLLKQAYGDGASSIQNVTISYMDPNSQTTNTKFWDPAHPVVTTILQNGVDIQAGHNVTVSAADFANIQIAVGNNITSNIFLTVPESFANGDFVGHTLNVTTLPSNLDANLPVDHAPTAADIVSTARMFATIENGVSAPNDCHNIATAIAASAGATLDPNSGNTANPALNEESGFWRIAYRGSDASAVDDWQSKVQAGDIVRMARTDGGVHTITVTAGLNADGNHPGQIEVVDNWNGVISEHWTDYDNNTVKGSITIYRVAADGTYLTDQSSDAHGDSILGSQFNDLMKAGNGNDTLTGGHGNDTLDGGAGDDTAIFSGKQSDYKISVSGNTTTLTDLRGGSPDGADTIKNIEHVKFADATVNVGDLKVTAPPAPAPVAGSVAISDVSVSEGANGTHVETFTVTRTGGSAAFDVNFATKDGSATTADGDYVAKSGSVHFEAGVNSQTISVVVNGDTKVEANETFNVNLSGVTNGATIADGQGVGTIVNDDTAPAPPPAPVAGSVSINDVSITEGNNGSHIETFTVTRTGGSAAFDVHFATQAGSASAADGDYVGKSGDLHFDAGVNTETISITVNGDAKVEANETFNVNLSAATNGATLADAQGVGTIVNDDTAANSHAHTANDFNGDGISDILFRNTSSGSVALWELNGNHIASNTTVGSAGLNWHADGIGDFNGDGKADVLWVSDKGQVATWQMNGDHIDANQTVGSVSSSWHVSEIADFNGDGKSDVLWQNDKGQVALWEMNGNHIAANETVGSVANGWHIEAAADFNGDGKADILLQNDSGKVAIWGMDGSHIDTNTTVGSVGAGWHVAGADDFNGDGKADVLWQNDSGKVAMWEMNGSHIDSNTTVGSASGWNVAGTGDVNHDGKADILLQNAAGHVAEWQMDGDHIAANLTVGSVSSDWHMV